jgi:aldehyde dehydrogenase (NAD+)
MAIQHTTIPQVRKKVPKDRRFFYTGGEWVGPIKANDYEVINPATEEPIAAISLGSSADVENAVAVASRAFDSYSKTTVGERLELLKRIVDIYRFRSEEMAKTISAEMGAPISLSRAAQVPSGLAHFSTAVSLLQTFEFETAKGPTLMRKEPIGVCGLITPWNWPMNQICCKVAPALAAGCTVVLKPSEIAPLSACLLAEILDEAGVPAGVFNLVNGDGPTVGAAIASHPAVAMVSFTGSTRAGIEVAKLAAPSVKRITQELGGKSANIILDDTDLQPAVRQGALACFRNSGQSCNAPTRMLVPRRKMADAVTIAAKVANEIRIGDPSAETTEMGPLANPVQYDKVQTLIEKGIDEGATLSAGGLGRPDAINTGYFAKATVFSDVTNDMIIAREEIFGPVLCILGYDKDEDAVTIANDSEYGLSAYVVSGNIDRARAIATRLQAGNVHINYARLDFAASFGGYKRSGNGREWGEAGLNEFLELKSIFGYQVT